MRGEPFTVAVPGGELAGWRSGAGEPVLLVHGGPGLSCAYLEDLVGELDGAWEVAVVQQRGVAPSTTTGPFDIARAIADLVAALDALGWERAWLVGHSWGGLLVLHAAAAAPERALGVLALDPLGAIGDGGGAALEAELLARTPEPGRTQVGELEQRFVAGTGTDDDYEESMQLQWPAYFASAEGAPPYPGLKASNAAYEGLAASTAEQGPALVAALPRLRVPYGCVVGAASPLPPEQAGIPTAEAVPGGWVEVIDGAGHAPWFECPGCVAAALRRLTTPRDGSG